MNTMTEIELKQYIQSHFPQENEACEWKDYSSLKHSFGAHEGEDIISYIALSLEDRCTLENRLNEIAQIVKLFDAKLSQKFENLELLFFRIRFIIF